MSLSMMVDRCDSTNNLAKKLAEDGCPHGSWVSCRVQESGRGRQGRKWESISGNLFLSYVARIPNPSVWSWVPLAAGVGIVRCIRTLYPEVLLQIKWPNDIYYSGAKVGGILCEGSQSYIVIGIGLNCVDSPQGLDQKTLDITTIRKGNLTTADEVRLPIIQALNEEFESLLSSGSKRVAQLYEVWAALPEGTPVQWGSPLQRGWVKMLGASGELIVENEANETIKIFADDVSIRPSKV